MVFFGLGGDCQTYFRQVALKTDFGANFFWGGDCQTKYLITAPGAVFLTAG